MARHKQTAPRRKQVQQQDHSSGDDAVQEEEQQQQQHALPVEPEQPYAVAAVVTAPAQQTQHAQVPLGAVAEFLVATKAAGTTPARAAPESVTVQLFTKPHAPGWRWASKPKQVLLFSWLCPGEDEHGPKHEVCCELPEQCGTAILQLLEQGYLSISIQQQQRQHDISQQSRLPQVLQPVQYATLTADSTYVSAFECDVLMAPEQAAVEAGLQRCSLLAATAAKAAGGPTASLAQQSHALLEAVAPLLPAQHVSLMAAAMAPGLLQPQHRQAQQQQGSAGSSSGAEQLAAAGDNQVAPKAAGALTLWRLQLCLTQRAMLASTHHSQQEQEQGQGQEQQVQDLQSVMGWLVPHWCCSHSSQHSTEFDAAEVYRVVKPSGQEVELQRSPPGLKPQLRPYQRRAVAWMLGLELGQHASAAAAAAAAGAAAAHAAPSYSGSVQQLLAGLLQPYSEWRSVLLIAPGSSNSDSSGNTSAGALPGERLGLRQLYLHPVLAHLSIEAPEETPVVPGGVLADEMGLGKTCELLSLIMSNRFKPAAGSPQQEKQHTGPLSANLPEQQQQLSRRSSSGGGGSSGTHACSRCGESFGARYTKDGKLVAETPACDSDGDTPMAPDDDADDYVPCASRKKGGKQPAGRGTKRMARSQQLPPLPPHGTGQHGGKRKRVVPRRLQESLQRQEEEEQEQQQSRAGSVSAHKPQGAAAAASGAGAAGALCSLCMREIALQEVEQDCGTTLIVVPANILVQWVDELQRHILPGSLSIKVYSGQPQADTSARGASRSRSSSPAPHSVRGAAAATAAGGKAAASNEVVTAAQLAAADIVLTTYDILRREVVLQPQTEAAPERSLRHRKRYAVVPTPLTRLSFWRLVLDEAQLAGGTGKAAEMAQHVRAQHRWAITGTPISHGGKSDLLGLLKFLQVPHIPAGIGGLLRLLCPVTGGLMWRTAKADVLLEMGIPPQHHHTTILRLSAIERHWYNRSHAECAAKARKVLQDALQEYLCRRDAGRGRRSSGSGNADAAVTAAKSPAKRVTAAIIAAGGDEQQLDAAAAELLDLQLGPAQLKKLLLPLLRLRQACCHPQVGASGIRAVISSHNSSKPLTMDQILSVLISRARVDAEEAQRQLAGALNGLAALLWLAQQQPEAVAAYREVLGLSEASKGVVRLDSFQLLHTLHNLAELLAELARKQQQRPRQQRGRSAAAAAAATGASATAAAAAEPDEPYGPGVPRTLRDGSLASEAAAIREQYLAQRQAELATAHQAFLKAAKDALPAGLGGSKRQQQSAGAAGSSGAGGGAQEGILDELLAAGDDLMGAVGGGGGARTGGDDVADGEGTAAGTSVGEGWYVAVIDALKEVGADEEVAEVIRVKLQESDTYIRQVEKNATTMANKFKTLGGLKLLLSQELSAINKHQADCLGTMCQLQEDVGGSDGPDQVLIEQAGQCGRCRSEMGVFGQVCRHCKLDESMRTLEARLFRLSTKALAAGTQLDASEAAAQAQAAAFRRVVGRGGLNEQAAENMAAAGTSGTAAAAAAASRLGGVIGPSSGAGARRADAAVSEAQVVRHPSEAERVLRLLQQQISKLGMTTYLPGVQEAAKQHLEQLEGSRKLFLAANSLSIAQRQLLYAHDELSMALLRITTRAEGEQVSAHEALYKLSRAEQVLKLEELTVEKAVAAGDLRRALGTLNYLKTIAGARTRVAAAATAAAGGDSKPGTGSQQAQQQQQQDKPDDPRAAAAAAALQRAAAAGSHEAACQEPTQIAAAAQQQLPEQPASADTPAVAAGGAAGAQGAADSAEEEKCPICFCAVAAAAAVLPCGHVLCCDCADGLAERIPAGTAAAHRYISCPSCRAHTHISDVAYVNSEQSSKHAYVSTSSTMAAAGSTSALAAADGTDPGGAAAAAATAAIAGAEYPFQGEQQLVLAGSYGTKIEAVVRRVLCVLQQDPANKVLVFSSWADVLGIVSHALSDNGILHAFAKGRKGLLTALERFKGCQVSSAELAAGGEGRPAAAASSSSSRASSSTRVVSAQGAGGSSGQQDSEQQQEEELRGLDGMDLDADSSDAAGGDDPQQQQQQQQQQSEGSPADDSPTGCLTAAKAAAAATGAGVSGAAAAAAAGPRVLLLLVSQGGLGLNLTEAQHVVLLEPLLDPALDVQAIGRVNRFGQTCTTHVHRFIVQDTVEENVARLSRERAAAMNMSAAVPAKGGTGGAAEVLLVRDVAALLSSKWREGAADP